MDNRKIGIFDSGIGGVTVLKEILKLLPKEDYIYYSDSKNNPYGDKTEKEILDICNDIIKFFIKNECKIVVIACNTASAIAAKKLREKYQNLPIIAIEPAYKMVYDFAYEDPTLIMATRGTIKSEKFNLLYNKYNNHKTYIAPCTGLADIIEAEEEKEIKEYLIKNIGKYKNKVKNVVLGCTHYPLIEDEIRDVLGNVTFFNGAGNLAKHLKEVMEEKNILSTKGGSIEFIDTSMSEEKKERFFRIIK